MHPDYEYDKQLHDSAKYFAEVLVQHGVEDCTPKAQNRNADVLAHAYLDLLRLRGLPPSLKCHPSIQLRSGAYFNFLDPESTPLSPRDIAEGLSKESRYGGHSLGSEPYTVAQHCCHASDEAPHALKFEALMHDAPEAVMKDIMTPLKQLLPDYKIIERNVTQAMAKQYGLPLEESPQVKEIDRRMMATEHRDLMPVGEWKMLDGIEPYLWRLGIWPHAEAKQAWLDRFFMLSRSRVGNNAIDA